MIVIINSTKSYENKSRKVPCFGQVKCEIIVMIQVVVSELFLKTRYSVVVVSLMI